MRSQSVQVSSLAGVGFGELLSHFPNACAEFVKPVKDAEKAWILKELKYVWLRSNLRYFVLNFRALKLLYNVLALGAVADFGAQNCQYTTKVDAR